MTDDKIKMDERDRSRVAAGEDYEVEYFAKRHRITIDKARQLIKRFGTDRDELEKQASRIA